MGADGRLRGRLLLISAVFRDGGAGNSLRKVFGPNAYSAATCGKDRTSPLNWAGLTLAPSVVGLPTWPISGEVHSAKVMANSNSLQERITLKVIKYLSLDNRRRFRKNLLHTNQYCIF
jgi:hypothetical protein